MTAVKTRLQAGLIIVMLIAGGVAMAQNSPISAPLNGIVTIQVGQGVEHFIQVELEEAGYLSVTPFLPPAAALPVKIQAHREAGYPEDLNDAIIEKPGTYTIAILPLGEYRGPLNIKIDFSAPLDPFEPNDDRQSARRVSLPFNALVRLPGREDVDWFSFIAPADTVVGVQLMNADRGTRLRVLDRSGRPVLDSSEEPGGLSGLRLISGDGQEKFIELQRTEDGVPPADETFMHLKIVAYAEHPTAVTPPGGIIAVDPDPSIPRVRQQLELLSAATGQSIVAGGNTDVIARSLIPSDTQSDTLPWLRILLGFGSLGAFLVAIHFIDRRMIRRRRRG